MTDFTKNPRLDVFHSALVKDAAFTGRYEFPWLTRSDQKPRRAVPFDQIKKTTDPNQWIHFYAHDYKFECVWRNPKQYLVRFQRFDGVITPDFSLYRELPLAMQIWNTYRSRALAFWMQRQGVPIVPNIRWGDERTYDFAFEGIAPGGTVATSTCGCIQQRVDRYYFQKGLAKMMETYSPKPSSITARRPIMFLKRTANKE